MSAPGWKPYGAGLAYKKRGRASIFLWRRGQRCRWFTEKGDQVGPEQANVAPAVVWAHGHGYSSGWLSKATAAVAEHPS